MPELAALDAGVVHVRRGQQTVDGPDGKNHRQVQAGLGQIDQAGRIDRDQLFLVQEAKETPQSHEMAGPRTGTDTRLAQIDQAGRPAAGAADGVDRRESLVQQRIADDDVE